MNTRGNQRSRASTAKTYDIRVPKPPLEEQHGIALEIDSRLAEFEKSTAVIRNEIQLLQEYRARLVTDVVTGKIDVRELAMRLPEEVALDSFAESAEEADETIDIELTDEETEA